MKTSSLLLKLLHILILLACFLPAIIPSCGGKNEKPTEADTTANVIEAPIDTISATTLKVLQPSDSLKLNTAKLTEDEKPESDTSKSALLNAICFLIQPDNNNYSVFGFTYLYFTHSCITIFFLLSCWSTWLCFRSNNTSHKFKVSIFAFASITIYVLDNMTEVVWGFWIVYALSSLILILSCLEKISANKKST